MAADRQDGGMQTGWRQAGLLSGRLAADRQYGCLQEDSLAACKLAGGMQTRWRHADSLAGILAGGRQMGRRNT
jgi:hypothetical protein